MTLRVAIVGSGIAGMAAAHLLHRRHDVTVFEAGDHVGGHTHTHAIEHDGERHAVDSGFIVFNHKTYPNFTRLLGQLGVASQASTMSFAVRCERTGLEYNGTTLDTLFIQRRNLLSPGFLGMVRDILRFNREGVAQAAEMPGGTVGELVTRHGYGRRFIDHYLVPMGAAIWSCPPRTFLDFPVRFVLEFFENHGLLQVEGRPVWRVITGGSARYVEALVRPFADRIRLQAPVRGVRREGDGVLVRTDAGTERFDEVVLACHADQALAMLEDPSAIETEVLAAFPYQANETLLHTDTRLLPRAERAWAAWNYHLPAAPTDAVTLTYDMNLLQGLRAKHTYCVSLNANGAIDPGRVLRRMTYHHPLYAASREHARTRHRELVRANRTSYCGAYWGYGFHEDGLVSALAVGQAFGEAL